MIGRRRFLAVSAAAVAGGPARAAPAPLRWRGRALGAEAAITLNAPEAQARPALKAALARLREAEGLFSLFDPASALSRLNAAGRLDAPAAPMLRLFARIDALHAVTGGLFDPTVQPLWRALAEGRDPAPAAALIGWERVRHGPEGIRLAPGQALTLNGIAQGFATDAVAAALRAHGLGDLLVNIGEFAGTGGPWRVGIEDPKIGPVTGRWLTEGAIATSSPAALSLGARSHILHPAGGAPRWSTVSVEAEDATLADGLSTALCLADRPAIAALHARLPGFRRGALVSPEGEVSTLA